MILWIHDKLQTVGKSTWICASSLLYCNNTRRCEGRVTAYVNYGDCVLTEAAERLLDTSFVEDRYARDSVTRGNGVHGAAGWHIEDLVGLWLGFHCDNKKERVKG